MLITDGRQDMQTLLRAHTKITSGTNETLGGGDPVAF